jgi:dihydroorotase
MSLKKFPGLIDVHVHLREPGATQKEDFGSGTKAAVAGGFVFVIDMPNNPMPTITPERLIEKIDLAKNKAVSDIGFHYGTDGKNLNTFSQVWNNPQVYGLKIYCNHTTGTLLVEDEAVLEQIFSAWNFDKPILVHAEMEKLELVIFLSEKFNRRLHVCHIARKNEVEWVQKAKRKNLKVTAGVTPHHLFLTDMNVSDLKGFGIMKPELGSEADQSYLWEGLNDGSIDIIETDHAPHTTEEKSGVKPPFGVPGLETALGLMLKAVKENRISLNKVIELMHNKPAQIFNIKISANTYIECDPDKPYIVKNSRLVTKCGWSPFADWELYGKVENVFLHGVQILQNNKFII